MIRLFSRGSLGGAKEIVVLVLDVGGMDTGSLGVNSISYRGTKLWLVVSAP